MNVYVIGSLKNRSGVMATSAALRSAGLHVFDDWLAAGPDADDEWQAYERERGRSYAEALNGAHARNVFDYDHKWLRWADAVVLVLPCGKSGHLELGWAAGAGKLTYIILDGEPERYDIMYRFAAGIYPSLDAFIETWSAPTPTGRCRLVTDGGNGTSQ